MANMYYLQNFKNYQNQTDMNESLKNWVSTFLLVAGLGMVPPSIAQSQDKNDKKEFVENLDKNKIDAAYFIKYLNSKPLTRLADLEEVFNQFKYSNNDIKSDFKDIKQFVKRSGKQYYFDSNYIKHDYSNVDITKFQPTNWLTDMGNMIEDSQEPIINNWISDYEAKTTVEIGVITITELPAFQEIEDYAVTQFRRLGVGKSGANNGILIVFSKNDRKWNITTGYGIEGVLTDYDCSQIGHDVIVPYFKKGDYQDGLIAALEEIKSIVGTDNIEDKKAWVKKNEEERSRRVAEELKQASEHLMVLLSALLGIGLIAYAASTIIKKRKLKKELEEDIHEIIDSIDIRQNERLMQPKIKSDFPEKTELTGSINLEKYHTKCKEYFASMIVDETKITPENKEAIDSIYYKVSELVDNYEEMLKRKYNFLSTTLILPKTNKELLSEIENALALSKSISNYGYESPALPDKSEVEALGVKVSNILSLVSKDLDSAEVEYMEYKNYAEKIKNKTTKVATTLSAIENAIYRSKNWNAEVERLEEDFRRFGGDSSELKKKISTFSKFASNSNDWFEVESRLDRLLAWMQIPIDEHYAEIERQEDERRRRLEEEKEEQRRRSSYSSSSNSWSSSSSSSSWSGFDGGSSGGGGASGSF